MINVEDAKRFLKKNKLIISLTSIVIMVLYIAFALYNLYSAVVLEGEKQIEQSMSQEEIVAIFEKEPEDINADELRLIEENLEAQATEFRIYVEDQEQDALSDANLFKDFLILDEVVSYVEEEAGVEIPVDLDLAVIVNRRGGHPVLSVRIRTGDYEDNLKLATAYMSAIEEDIVPLVQNRLVHILDDEPALYEPTLLTQIMENMSAFSPVGIVLGSVVALILGSIIGVLLGIMLGIKKGKVDELRILQEDSSDKIVPLYRIKNEADRSKQLEYAIVYNGTKEKLVLSEFDLDEPVHSLIEKKGLEIVNDLSQSDVTKTYKNVIILTELDKTTVNWYKAQRIQLKNIDANITIIQV